MKKNKKLFTLLINVTAILLIATSAMDGAEIKLALDCPPDADK